MSTRQYHLKQQPIPDGFEIFEERLEKAKKQSGVAPWYYEKLAIVFRKQRRYADEVSILERLEQQPKSPGVGARKTRRTSD